MDPNSPDPAELPIEVAPIVSALGALLVANVSVTASQRSVLAALVLHGDSGATTTALTDAIWPERAPATARASVQNQVARLRRALGDEAILCDGGRYHLTLPTDVERFDRAHASTAQPLGSVSTDSLEAALALWRGLPYSDLPDDHHAHVARVRLESQRSELIERLAIERLLAGQPDDAAGGLRVRVTAEPYHERAWELLIAAQYVAGRRTEALATYADLAQLLADRLDIDPSASLRRLRVRVATERSLDIAEMIGRTQPSSARLERLPA